MAERNYKYKVLQDIDLSQNSIENPSTIKNTENIQISSSKEIIEEGSKVTLLNTSGTNKIIVNPDKVSIEGNLLEITSGNASISSETTITGDIITKGKINSTLSSDIKIGNDNASLDINGKNLSMKSGDISKISSGDVEFTNSLYSNDIKIYWDSNRNSLVFSKK